MRNFSLHSIRLRGMVGLVPPFPAGFFAPAFNLFKRLYRPSAPGP